MAFTQQEINRLKELGLPTDGLETVRYDKKITDNFSQEEINKLKNLGANIPLDENTTIGEDLSILGSALKRGTRSVVGGSAELLGLATNSDALKGISESINIQNKADLEELQKNQNIKQNMNNEDLINFAKGAEFAGQSVPVLASMLFGGGVAKAGATALGAGAKVANNAFLGGLGSTSGLVQGGQAAVMAKDDAMARILQENPNISQEELNSRLEEIGKNVALQSGTLNAISAPLSMVVGGAVGNRLIANNVSQGLKSAGIAFGADQLNNIPTAVLEEVIQAENVDREINKKNIASNIVMGGISSGVLGGIPAYKQARALGNEINTLNQSGLEVQQPQGFELFRRGIALPEEKAKQKMEFLQSRNPDSVYSLEQSNVNGKFYVVEKVDRLDNTSFNNEINADVNTALVNDSVLPTEIQPNTKTIEDIIQEARLNQEQVLTRQEQGLNEPITPKQEEVINKQEEIDKVRQINDGLKVRDSILNITDPSIRNQSIIENLPLLNKTLDLLDTKNKSAFLKDVKITNLDEVNNKQLQVVPKNINRSTKDIVFTKDAKTLINDLGIKDIPEIKDNKVALNENITNFKLNKDNSITATATLRGAQYSVRRPSDLSINDKFKIVKELVSYETQNNKTPVTENQFSIYDQNNVKVGVLPKEMANLFNKLDNNGKIDTNSLTVSSAKYEKMPYAELTNEFDSVGGQRKVRITNENNGKVTTKLLSDFLSSKNNEDYIIVKETDENGNFIKDSNGRFIEVLARPIIDINFNTLKPLESEIVKGSVYNPKKGLDLLDKAENIIRDVNGVPKEFISQKEYDSLNEIGKKSYDKNKTVKNKNAGEYQFNRYTESDILTLKNETRLNNDNINNQKVRENVLNSLNDKEIVKKIIDVNNPNLTDMNVTQKRDFYKALKESENSNGFLFMSDGEMFVGININNIRKSKDHAHLDINDAIEQVKAHEILGHGQLNKSFKTIEERNAFLQDLYTNHKEVLDKFIEIKKEFDSYKNEDINLLIEEVASDLVSGRIQVKDKNGNTSYKTIEEFSNDKTFLNKVYDFIKNLINKFTGKEIFKNDEVSLNLIKKSMEDLQKSPLKKIEKEFFENKNIPESTKEAIRVYHNATTRQDTIYQEMNTKEILLGALKQFVKDKGFIKSPFDYIITQKQLTNEFTGKNKEYNDRILSFHKDNNEVENILTGLFSNSKPLTTEQAKSIDLNNLSGEYSKAIEKLSTVKYIREVNNFLVNNDVNFKYSESLFKANQDIDTFRKNLAEVYGSKILDSIDGEIGSVLKNKQSVLNDFNENALINNIAGDKALYVKNSNGNLISFKTKGTSFADNIKYNAEKLALENKYGKDNVKEIDLTFRENQRTSEANVILTKALNSGLINKQELLVQSTYQYAKKIQTLNINAVENQIKKLPQSKERDYLLKAIDNSRKAENETVATIRAINSLFALGGNMATAFMNMTSLPLLLKPYMIANNIDGSVANVFTKILSSNKYNNFLKHANASKEDFINQAMKDFDYLLTNSKQKEDFKKVLNILHERGVFGDDNAFDIRNNLLTSNNGLTKSYNKATQVLMHVFKKTENVNRSVSGLISALDGIKKGHDIDTIIKNTQNLVDYTQGNYSKENSPLYARNPIGRLIEQFKRFPMTYVSLISQIAKKDKKTLGIALGILISLAGSRGIPFNEDLEDLVDTVGQQFGYNTDFKQFKDDILTGIVGKDANKLITYGLLPYLGLGNLSDRFSFANILPGTSLLKKTETDKASQVKEMGGLTATTMVNIVNGLNKMSSGEIGKGALEVMPTAVKNVVKGAVAFNDGYFVDSQGRRTVDASKLDAGLKMLGIQSNSSAELYRNFEKINTADKLAKLNKKLANDLHAKYLIEKDESYKKKSQDIINEWNKNNPDRKIFLNFKSINKKVKEAKMTAKERFSKSLDKTSRKDFESYFNEDDNQD